MQTFHIYRTCIVVLAATLALQASFLTASSQPTLAQPEASQPAGTQDVDCRSPVDQTSMNVCAKRSYEAADERLNEVYRRLLAKVGDEAGERLKKAQRAWIAYRDAQCDFDTLGTRDGSIHPTIVAECLQTLTEAQTDRLSAQADCEEGDLSCGGQ